MKRPQIRFRSFYAKLVIMFLLMGMIPFLFMGMMIYNVYSNTMYENILGNFSMTDQIMAKNISDLISELSDDTEYIYIRAVYLIMITFMNYLKIQRCLRRGGMQ